VENQVYFLIPSLHSIFSITHIYLFLDHLTSFALLLNGNGNDPCDDNQEDYIITWISLAFVGLAIFFVIGGIAGYEIYFRFKIQRYNRTMSKISLRISKMSKE